MLQLEQKWSKEMSFGQLCRNLCKPMQEGMIKGRLGGWVTVHAKVTTGSPRFTMFSPPAVHREHSLVGVGFLHQWCPSKSTESANEEKSKTYCILTPWDKRPPLAEFMFQSISLEKVDWEDMCQLILTFKCVSSADTDLNSQILFFLQLRLGMIYKVNLLTNSCFDDNDKTIADQNFVNQLGFLEHRLLTWKFSAQKF